MADPKVKVVTEVDDTQAVRQLETMLRNLQKAAEAVGKSLSSAATGSAKYDAATVRAALASERLATAATKTALGQQRVATETERTAAAHARAEAATTRAATASQRLTQQQQVQTQSTVSLKDNVDTLVTTLRNVTFVAGVVGTTFQKAFEFAEQGARIDQTTLSFERFSNEIVGIPSLLDDLRAAASGTITDFDLMSQTLTLVSGTSQETGAQLARNAPQLLEIARAAQILNPALGDVTYFYESLNTGIKRLERRWLDNLGIVVKASEAYANYAAQVGKTVDELSAEERTQAFLNETLRVGNLLIEQAGGTTSESVDAYSRLRVEVEETKNAFKSFLGEGLLPYVQLINGDWSKTWQAQIEGNRQQAQSLERLIEQYRLLVVLQGALAFVGLTQQSLEVAESFAEVERQMMLTAGSVEEYNIALIKVRGPLGILSTMQEEAFNAEKQRLVEGIASSTGKLGQAEDIAARAAMRLAAAESGLQRTEEARQAVLAALTEEQLKAIQSDAALADSRERLLRLGQSGDPLRQAIYNLQVYGQFVDRTTLAQQRFNNLLNSTNFGPLIRGLLMASRGMNQLQTVSAGAASAFINALDGMTESVAGAGGGSFVSAEEQAIQKQKEWNAAFAQGFMQLLDAEEPIENWNTELLRGAAAAGASAETLALLAAATGEYSEEQIASALHGAAMKQAIEEISQALADGRATGDQALAALAGYQEQLAQGGSFEFDLQAYGIEPLREAVESAGGGAGAAADETKNWAKELLALAGQGNLTAGDLVLLATATGEYTDAQIKAALKTLFMTQKLEELSKQIGKRPIQDIIADLREFETKLDSDFELTLFTQDAEEGIDRVHRKIDEIPTEVTVKIHVEADEIPNYNGIPGQTSTGMPGTGGGGQQHGGPLSTSGSIVGEVRKEMVVGGQVIPRIPPGFFVAQEGFAQTMALALANSMASLPSYSNTTNINRTSTTNNNQRSSVVNVYSSGASARQIRELGAF